MVPLKTSPFHTNQLNRGSVRALQIFTDRNRKWWATLAVRIPTPLLEDHQLPDAVLGIDLGVKKAACTTLLTEKKVSETIYFHQKEKVKLMEKYDRLYAGLQSEQDTRRSNGASHNSVTRRMKHLRTRRGNVAKEYDRVLVKELLDYIEELSREYTLYVALGRVKGIRGTARKGNCSGSGFRSMIHSWSFSRISESLKHGLAQRGWTVEGPKARFQAVPEQWTSTKCWKCGHRGHRPKQSLFVCSCGFKTNADRNGALNIARRLIILIPSLKNEAKGLGRWANPERAPAPKARQRGLPSKRKSLLSSKGDASHLGESAAVHHAQMSLLEFGDGIKEGDNDPAVVRTEKTLSVTGNDATRNRQEKETTSNGGITFQ